MSKGDKVNTEYQFCITPNQHATPASLEVCANGVIFHGYQEFFLSDVTHEVLPKDSKLRIKYELLNPYFKPKFLAKRTLLDLGANGAFYCFWALNKGAESAIAVDIDDTYLKMVDKAAILLNVDRLETFKSNIADWRQQSDVVIALALIHWIYSCSAVFGSLDVIIAKLSELTKYMLIIEWIAPDDEAIHYFQHLNWNQDGIIEAYNIQAFERSLGKYFSRVQKIGDVSPTRSLYVAFHSPREIDFSGPLPLLKNKDNVISSRLLTVNNGAEYWSIVYDDGALLYKQTSYDLAQREGQFLQQLSDSEYFPNVYDIFCASDYTLITLEKIQGKSLVVDESDQFFHPEWIYNFTSHCLSLLLELNDKGIIHRDIHAENLMIRDCKPVLIDFGWAISKEQTYFTPSGLGVLFRPPDGSFCDIYSMGQVLKCLSNPKNTGLNILLRLMTFPESELRLTDINFLKTLLEVAKQIDFDNSGEEVNMAMNEGTTPLKDTRLLLHQLDRYAQKINWLESELLRQRELNFHAVSLSQALTERNSQITDLTQVIAEKNTVIAEKDTVIAEKDTVIAEKDTVIAELEEQIKGLFISTSWIVTKPFRFVSRLFKMLYKS